MNYDSGDRLRAAANLIAEATLARDYARRPSLLDRYGEAGRRNYRQDIIYNVEALAAALDTDDAGMFLRYVGWLKVVLIRRGVALDDIAESLRCMGSALLDAATPHPMAASYVEAAQQQLETMPDAVASYLGTSSEEHLVARRCLDALLRLDAAAVRETLEAALAANLPLTRIYSGVLPPLMREIGRLWQMNEIGVALEHYCSAAMQSILSGFYSRVFGAARHSDRSLMVTCVEGEQHEIGARTLADVFELNGWRTSFLGANLPARELVTLIRKSNYQPDLIALSATMPAHLTRLTSTIAAIRDGRTSRLWWRLSVHDSPGLVTKMAADGYAADAEAALAIADGLMARRGHPHRAHLSRP